MWEQLKRELGIFSHKERLILRDMILLYLGGGGMGAWLMLLAARQWVKTIIISEPDVIERSNLGRQGQTFSDNIGERKIWAIVEQFRRINSDTTLYVVDGDLTSEIMQLIANDIGRLPDIAFEEIELYEYSARIRKHIMLRELGVTMINANAITFGTYCFFFTPEGQSFVHGLGYTDTAMRQLLNAIEKGLAREEDVATLGGRVLQYLIPELIEYAIRPEEFSTVQNWLLAMKEKIAIIHGPVPGAAANMAFIHAVQHLLKKSFGDEFNRKTFDHPLQPGYLYRDLLLPENDKVSRAAWCNFLLIEKFDQYEN